MRADRSVSVEKQRPHGAAEFVIADCPYSQLTHAVTVEITQRGRRLAEPVAVLQDCAEAALGCADLLVRQHPAGLGRRRLERGDNDQHGRCLDTSCD